MCLRSTGLSRPSRERVHRAGRLVQDDPDDNDREDAEECNSAAWLDGRTRHIAEALEVELPWLACRALHVRVARCTLEFRPVHATSACGRAGGEVWRVEWERG